MDHVTLGWIGAIAGTILGVAGAFIGSRAALEHAANQAQRLFLRKVTLVAWGLLVAFGIAVWLTATGIWPRWIYWAVMVVWFAGLGPAICWGNRRLADLDRAESSGSA